jgi:hypothetical protein
MTSNNIEEKLSSKVSSPWPNDDLKEQAPSTPPGKTTWSEDYEDHRNEIEDPLHWRYSQE